MNNNNHTTNQNKSMKAKNAYDDDNTPRVDMARNKNENPPTEPLPESFRPRKDGPGGN